MELELLAIRLCEGQGGLKSPRFGEEALEHDEILLDLADDFAERVDEAVTKSRSGTFGSHRRRAQLVVREQRVAPRRPARLRRGRREQRVHALPRQPGSVEAMR